MCPLPPVSLPQEPPAVHLPAAAPPRRGDLCLRCQTGRMDYNGLLELECDHCGYSLSSGAGCS